MFLEERVNLSFTTCINIPLVTARYSAGSLFQRFEYPEVRYFRSKFVIPLLMTLRSNDTNVRINEPYFIFGLTKFVCSE